MDALFLARWQFALTTIYHWFFVPVTLGLSLLVAIMQTQYVRTGDEAYKRMTKFWGKLFLLNFAMGVVTGIVQEFQFGMNWSEYSRYVGDIFGAPLAIEALMAFFIESTFIGVWLFGWERLPKKIHLASIWLVAIASNLSAIWILAANSFMQEPVGYVVRNGRAEMLDFLALLGNGHLWVQYPHVFFAGVVTSGFIVVGISAFHLMRETPDRPLFQRSIRMGVIYGAIGALVVSLVGHTQAQHMIRGQPMKMAAAEALWNTESPAALSLFTIGDEKNRTDRFAIKIPNLLTFMAYNQLQGEVKGINDLNREYREKYGPSDYVPPVAVSYWSFRLMVGSGVAMIALMAYALYLLYKRRLDQPSWFLRFAPWFIALPYVANATGWILTEVGRAPWLVFGLLRQEQGVSLAVTPWMLGISLLAFVGLYTALLFPFISLIKKFGFAAPRPQPHVEPVGAPGVALS